MEELGGSRIDHKGIHTRIALGAGAMILVVLVIALVFCASGINDLRQGIDEGFEINGAYIKDEVPGSFISFVSADDALSWQARDAEGRGAEGNVERTEDPNLYILRDPDGKDVGIVHLAYSDREAKGTLFVRIGDSEVVQLKKFSRTPLVNESVVVDSGDSA